MIIKKEEKDKHTKIADFLVRFRGGPITNKILNLNGFSLSVFDWTICSQRKEFCQVSAQLQIAEDGGLGERTRKGLPAAINWMEGDCLAQSHENDRHKTYKVFATKLEVKLNFVLPVIRWQWSSIHYLFQLMSLE